MAIHGETRCPFCDARIDSRLAACPSCDLPLLGERGEHPPPRGPAQFDGAAPLAGGIPGLQADTRIGEGPLLAAEHPGAGAAENLRCVVVAINQGEAEMLCQVLRAEGIRCMVRTPDLHSYASGSVRCEVLVRESDLQASRELLRIPEPNPVAPSRASGLLAFGALTLLLVGAAAAVATAIAQMP